MASRMATFALGCFLAAAAWPWVAGGLAGALMSPLERATQKAWCGMPLHSTFELLGHCAACWAGSALLAATGAALLWRDRAGYVSARLHRQGSKAPGLS